jgi:GH25 family lysozyme M1 (1,4-beta-N-acetylmuramidase)
MLGSPRTAADGAEGATLAGVDVSNYQGPPADWRAEAGKISWAAVKITELQPGGIEYVNPDAAADWAYLLAKHKGRIGYLFGHPSVGADATVDFFVSQLTGLGLSDADAVCLDLEETDGRGAADVDAWAVLVMAHLEERLGRRPLLYTYISFAQAGNCASLGRYPLWIADPSNPKGSPEVPAPWTTWAIQQYATTGDIDRDVANYPSLAAMAAALGKPGEPELKNIGGAIVGAVAAARWDGGVVVVAGLCSDGYVHVARWDKDWGAWSKVSPTTAVGPPGLTAWGSADGRLFYAETDGNVCVLETADGGKTWT